jgi:sporulation protein YlmC with PRC-barrel domain
MNVGLSNLPLRRRCDLEERFYRREELVGKIVYDSKALRVGEVTDVGYSKEGHVALIVKADGGEEKVIPFTMVEEIGDIILLKSTKPFVEPKHGKPLVEPSPQQQKPEQVTTIIGEGEKVCPECGRRNIARAKFCVKCGYKFSS